MVKEEGLAEEPEGGLRCSACFDMRLDRSAEVAQERGFDYFGSAITLSKNKNSQLINELGIGVQQNYDSRYLPSDFKKVTDINAQLKCVMNMTCSVSVIVDVHLQQKNKV